MQSSLKSTNKSIYLKFIFDNIFKTLIYNRNMQFVFVIPITQMSKQILG